MDRAGEARRGWMSERLKESVLKTEVFLNTGVRIPPSREVGKGPGGLPLGAKSKISVVLMGMKVEAREEKGYSLLAYPYIRPWYGLYMMDEGLAKAATDSLSVILTSCMQGCSEIPLQLPGPTERVYGTTKLCDYAILGDGDRRREGILCSPLLSGILVLSVGGSLPLPGPSRQGSGAEFEEDHFGIDVLLESWDQSTETGTSLDQPEAKPGHVSPAIQVAPRGNEAGPSNQPPRVVPYLYQLDEVIGVIPFSLSSRGS
ncbi:hypothetical protein HAX54_005782 [Datura stramonium]|uniref:Uncharacterized protein n=1 Tax=Datura stramonium TaxID=4076 RepID=A0ABS8WTM0_DATST|nr:hypothetical protein [Datura stramonium]